MLSGRKKHMLIKIADKGVVDWMILCRGVGEDYQQLVDGYLLSPGYLGRLLFHGRV